MAKVKRFLPFFILTLLVTIYFWEIISGQKYFWEDVLEHYYPYHYFLFSHLKHFSLPLWNPYIFSGMPFLGDVQSQIFYPLNWFFAFFSSPESVFYLLEIKIILHFLLGGIFFYLFLRRLNLSPLSSLFGAIIFSFSGFLIMHLIHVTMVNTFIWLPLIFLFLFSAFNKKNVRDSLFAGIALGMANLASHPQITLHFLYTILFFFLFFLISYWKSDKSFLRKKGFVFLLLVFLVGFGLAGVQYLPSYEHSKYTLREEMTFTESAEVSLPFSFPLLLLIPKFFGSITGDGTDSVPFWRGPGYYYWETAIYLGIIPFLFALFGIFFNRRKEKVFFILLAIIALFAGLGKYTPFYRFLFEYLPGFKHFRIPARFCGLFTFAMAVLAGFGMESFIKEEGRKFLLFQRGLLIFLFFALFLWLLFLFGLFRGLSQFLPVPEVIRNINHQFMIFLIFLFIGIILFWWRRRKEKIAEKLTILAIIFTFLDLYLFGKNFNLSSEGPFDHFPKNRIVHYLQEERRKEIFRINARKGRYMILKRNEGMIHGLELLEGYTPLGLADYATFSLPLERKCDLLNAKYKIKVDEITGKMDLVLNSTYLPRVRMFYQYLVERNRERVLKILSDEGFEYRNCLVLEKEPSFPSFPADSVPNQIEVLKMENERMELKVYTERPGLLFLSEIYYPNWRVKIDGKEGEIYRADYCLRAVPIREGNHYIIFYYDTRSLKLGTFLTFLTLLFILVFLFGKEERRG